MKEIGNLVEANGGGLQDVERAVRYFDTNEMFQSPLMQLEANLFLLQRINNPELANAMVAKNVFWIEQLADIADQDITEYAQGKADQHPTDQFHRIDNLVTYELAGAVLVKNPSIIDAVMVKIADRYTPSQTRLFKDDQEQRAHEIDAMYMSCADAADAIGYTRGFNQAVSRFKTDWFRERAKNYEEERQFGHQFHE